VAPEAVTDATHDGEENAAASETSVTRPAPVITAENAFFWEAAARGELVAQRCGACAALHHPPRPMCPRCHDTRREVARLSGRGVVYSWIVPRSPAPIGFAEPPVVALIDLDEGLRLVSNVVGVAPEAMRNGLRVEVAFAPTAGGHVVPVFRPSA
jgi:hypothetical protein